LKNILIIQTASIGDAILATPVAEKLHRFYPEARISLLVKKGNESLFSGHPFLREVLTWDKSRKKYRNLLSLLLTIRKRRYDHVINLQRFASTGFLVACSGIPRRTGFDKNPFHFFYTDVIPHEIGEGIHEIDRNLRLIENMTDLSRVMPRLYPSAADENAVIQWTAGKFYTLSPASLWFTKQYPPEKWAELIRAMDPESTVCLLGSEEDRNLCDHVIRMSGHTRSVNLAGRLTFLQSAALMKRARMNFSNDSAAMHLCSAVNAPVTVIYCSTLPSFGFGPLSDDPAVIETPEKLSCRPCGLHGLTACPEKHFRCATTIPLARLLARC
jgi:heptosyltransferase-2